MCKQWHKTLKLRLNMKCLVGNYDKKRKENHTLQFKSSGADLHVGFI